MDWFCWCAGASEEAPAARVRRQKSPGGTKRETVSCEAMVVNTWFNAVSGTAFAHTVVSVGLLGSFIGTEKKYCDRGNEDMPCIVSQGLSAPPSVEQPVVSEP